LLRTARFYLASVARVPACRFDALLVNGNDNSIEWLKNAIAE
jgi:Holliday junction resolvase-like predicted endonuclease